ncbi:MAG: hypothetical protein EOO38_20365 [Cytophagaceae bacterium]|nr:MAG: hypothetical protein EOO38_20365 [Cytophagaceae bacterium]
MPLYDLRKGDWDTVGKATLCDFLHIVANTPLKIKILSTFLYDPYLCISSDHLAQRLKEDTADVRRNVRELWSDRAFHYCSSFGYSDLCSLSFQRHTPTIQHCLGLLRLALRLDPEFVWEQVGLADPFPHRDHSNL